MSYVLMKLLMRIIIMDKLMNVNIYCLHQWAPALSEHPQRQKYNWPINHHIINEAHPLKVINSLKENNEQSVPMKNNTLKLQCLKISISMKIWAFVNQAQWPKSANKTAKWNQIKNKQKQFVNFVIKRIT